MTRRGKKQKKKPKKAPGTKAKPGRREVNIKQLDAIVERTKSAPLTGEDHNTLRYAVETLSYLTQQIEAKGASIRRLRKLIFGSGTEKTSRVVGKTSGAGSGSSGEAPAASDGKASDGKASDGKASDGKASDGKASDGKAEKPTETKKSDTPRKGHGRNGAADYHGAEKVTVPHESLTRGDRCPECPKGKVYPLSKPRVLVRVTGMAPLNATVVELERLRCNLCGMIFTAAAPEDMGEAKYDETAASMIGLLKYGCGLPFTRLEKLETSLGIPLPAGTQWEVVERAADLLTPAHDELVRQAAQGTVLHNDDTTAKILELLKEQKERAASGEKKDDRTGIFTTGIVSITGEGHKTALFYTGRHHAGENLAELLQKRAAVRLPPIQMCDGLPVNTAGDFETIVANCMAHARRKFVDVASDFPSEVRHILEKLGTVDKHDAAARRQEMSDEKRLRDDRSHSEREVEPNSVLGEAMNYMERRWDKLTLFLRVAGAPLDNNIVERALKRAILHRKNALFYKTENGARVGDLFMSLIHTCELCGANPFDYLVSLQRHAGQVAEDPAVRMPWNYRETLEALASEP